VAKTLKVVALIPLRGGSKSIPLKNIKPLDGQPLCAWVIKAAQQTPEISEVWVSTDHPRIREVSLGLGAKVLDRPAALATDVATTDSVMVHFMNNVRFDILITIQATSPLTQSEDISIALKKFTDDKLDSLLTAVPIKRFFWTHDNKPINYDPANRPMRQQFRGSLVENGAFYITSRKTLKLSENRLGGKIGIYQMSDESTAELDEPSDWRLLEKIIRKKNRNG
jgi:N-acylneuraminate cytidylyltransferase